MSRGKNSWLHTPWLSGSSVARARWDYRSQHSMRAPGTGAKHAGTRCSRAACGRGRLRALELPAPVGLGGGHTGHELGWVDPCGPAGAWGQDDAGMGVIFGEEGGGCIPAGGSPFSLCPG